MDYLKQFIEDRGLSAGSIKNYRLVVKKYENYFNMAMEELIEEADHEEEIGVRWKKRKLKQRLVDFRGHIYSTCSRSTGTTYMNCIKAVYRHFEIEIHPLPRYSKQLIEHEEIGWNNMITKKEIAEAYEYADDVTRACILFMSSSGLSRWDTCHSITVGQFINSLYNHL